MGVETQNNHVIMSDATQNMDTQISAAFSSKAKAPAHVNYGVLDERAAILQRYIVAYPIERHSLRPAFLWAIYFNKKNNRIAGDFIYSSTKRKKDHPANFYTSKELQPVSYHHTSLRLDMRYITRFSAGGPVKNLSNHQLDNIYIPDLILRRVIALTDPNTISCVPSYNIADGSIRIGLIFNSINPNLIMPDKFAPEVPALNPGFKYQGFENEELDQDLIDAIASLAFNYVFYCRKYGYPVLLPPPGHFKDWDASFLGFVDDKYQPQRDELSWFNKDYEGKEFNSGFLNLKNDISSDPASEKAIILTPSIVS